MPPIAVRIEHLKTFKLKKTAFINSYPFKRGEIYIYLSEFNLIMIFNTYLKSIDYMKCKIII